MGTPDRAEAQAHDLRRHWVHKVGSEVGSALILRLRLKFSYLLRRIPTLIIQTKSDKATTYGMLMEEYNEIAQNKNVQLKVFERGSHTRIYAESDYKEEYTQAVADFLKGVG